MHTIITGTNHLIVNFYSAYFDMLEMENEHYTSISVGLKRATMNASVKNIIIILETREDYLIYSKMRTSINDKTVNIILICLSEELMALAASQKTFVMSHKDITREFTDTLSKNHICRPYMQEEIKTRSPEKILKHIQNLLLNGNIALPVKTDCALHLLSALDNDDISFKTIDSMTKTDPALHSGIIKMANSVYFSGAFSNVKDVEKALVRVGLSNVKVFLINFVNRSLAANKDLIFAEDIAEAIDKSLLIASLCYVMAEDFKAASPVTMFSIGLLSRLGEIFMYAAISDYFSGTQFNEQDKEDYRTLTKNVGVTLSGLLLKKWKFAEDYSVPITNALTLNQNKYMKETRILHLAMNMIDFYNNGVSDEKLKEAMNNAQICVPDYQLEKIRSDTARHLCMVSSVLS